MQMRGSHSAFCRLTPSSAISIVIIYHQLVFLPPLVILHISTPPANFVHWDTFGGNHVSHCRYFFAWWWCLLLDKCPDLVIIMFWEERLVAAAATYLWSQDELGVAYCSAQITKCSFSINCNAHLNTYIMLIYDWWARPLEPDHLPSKKFFKGMVSLKIFILS